MMHPYYPWSRINTMATTCATEQAAIVTGSHVRRNL